MDLSRHNGSDNDFYKTIGGLEATVLAHEKRLDEINDKLDTLIDVSNRLKGGWWVLSGVLGLAALLGEFSHSIIDAFRRLVS